MSRAMARSPEARPERGKLKNKWADMTDKTDSDFDDLDAYLNEDGPRRRRDVLDETCLPAAKGIRYAAESGTGQDATMQASRRLLARAAHALADLQQTGSAQSLNAEILELDQQLGKEISSELDAWNAAVDSLETLLSDGNGKNLPCRRRFVDRASGCHQPKRAATPAGLPEPVTPAHEAPDQGTAVNRIVIALDGRGNLKFPLDKAIMTIGRKADNDIAIRSRFISRYHARIVSDADGAVIEDMDSRNGVSVNAERVRRRLLRSGDLIDIGQTQLQFIDLGQESPSEGNA